MNRRSTDRAGDDADVDGEELQARIHALKGRLDGLLLEVEGMKQQVRASTSEAETLEKSVVRLREKTKQQTRAIIERDKRIAELEAELVRVRKALEEANDRMLAMTAAPVLP